MGRAILLLKGAALLTMMAGCSLFHHGSDRGASCAEDGDELPLPAVKRISQEPGMLRQADYLQLPQPPGDPQPPILYRAIPPHFCQCLAAKHAPLADGLDNQRRQIEKQQAHASCLCGRKTKKQRVFQTAILLYSALEIRDQAAGEALQWYYQLAGGEAKADLLNNSLDRGRQTLERVEQLKKLGIPLPAPIEEYQRQLVELQLQQAQNQLTIEQLNSKLRLAMGYHPTSVWRFWPDPTISLDTETVSDTEAAVHLGLAQRPQLLLLRSAIANLDRDTLGSVQSLLQAINPLLAMSNPGPNCELLKMLGKILHFHPGQKDEVERIRAQLIDYLRERERTVEAEIRETVYEIGARREATILAREAADSWDARIRDLEKQHSEGIRGVAELNKAYMDSYKARGEVVKEFLGWKIAAAKLKQAQGVLPAECGYNEHESCTPAGHACSLGHSPQ